MLISPFLAETALKFGAPEMFALLFFAFTCIGGLTGKSRAQGLLMACVGLLLGTIGTDDIQGVDRFTFGILYLQDGIGLVPLAMGIFGLGEILYNIEKREEQGAILETPKSLLPTLADWKRSALPIARGSFLGFGIGIIPGGMPAVASLMSYALEKRVAKHPEEFGHGAIEGVAGPETANNAATAGGFVPLLTLGIPTNSVLALMLAAMMLHGVTPGPLLLLKWPDVFWGVIASMYIGNVMLIILNRAADRALRAAPQGALRDPLAPDHHVHPAGGVRPEKQCQRSGGDDPVRPDGIPDEALRHRARAPDPGLRSRADAGEQPEQGPDHVPYGQPALLLFAAHLGDAALSALLVLLYPLIRWAWRRATGRPTGVMTLVLGGNGLCLKGI